MIDWQRSLARTLCLGAWCALAAMALAQPSPAPSEKPGARAIIGFVEDVPATEQLAGPGKPVTLEPHVRVAFAKMADGWKPACVYSEGETESPECLDLGLIRKVSWTVIHQGKQIGGVETDGWYDARYYRTLGVLKRISPSVPRVGKPEKEFASWLAPEAHRPLVALRDAKPVGTPGWTAAKPSSADMATVHAIFLLAFKTLPNCKTDAGAIQPIELRHLSVSHSSQSTAGERLLGVRLDPKLASGCEGPLGLEWSDLWFHAPVDRPPAMVPVEIETDLAPFRMSLLEIGDFDGDGKPEALFWFSSHNVEGYLLVHDQFERQVRFLWKYQ
ncbi:MAG: hypothetical protein ACKVQT_05685 [Burkholderiales bacterium]